MSPFGSVSPQVTRTGVFAVKVDVPGECPNAASVRRSSPILRKDGAILAGDQKS